MTHAQALLLALDPSRILCAQGLTPDPWQRELLLSTHPQVLLNCSRQSGKSTTVAALALHTALFRAGSLTLLLSPTERQSQEVFRKVLDGYQALHRPHPSITRTQTQLELANRSRVVCLPGREETLRGYSKAALLIIDEAAQVSDDLYRTVRPMRAVSHGRLICLSTPFGPRGFFWREWHNGGAAWQRFRVPASECPRIRPEFLEQERRSLGESWVNQEYFCSFESLAGLVYPDFEQLCAVAQAPGQGKAVGGIDFGFRNPFAAVWGHVDRDDVLWIIRERYQRQTPLPEHARALPRETIWYADPSGRQEIEALRQAGLVVRRGVNDIRAGIAAVSARVRSGRLKVVASAAPNLLAEARLYRYPSERDSSAATEDPLDQHNHALDALRYLIASVDRRFIARIRQQPAEPAEQKAGETTASWMQEEVLWRAVQ
jgi:hypothetical protein